MLSVRTSTNLQVPNFQFSNQNKVQPSVSERGKGKKTRVHKNKPGSFKLNYSSFTPDFK
jgi:hypothetical protein